MRRSTKAEIKALWRALRVATNSRTNDEAATYLLLAKRHVTIHSRPVVLSEYVGGDWTASFTSPARGGGAMWHMVRLQVEDILEPRRIIEKCDDLLAIAAEADQPVEPSEYAMMN